MLFVLWSLANGIDNGSKGTLVKIITYIGLVLRLVRNTVLLFRK